MGYRIAADLTAMVHLLFVIFVFGLLYPSGLDRQT